MGISVFQKSTGKVPTATRHSVPVNALFRYLDRYGKPTGAIFANLGFGDNLGRYFSVAVDGDKKGSLSGGSNGSKPVQLLGTFTVEAKLAAARDHREVSRSSLTPGDVFQVPNSKQAKRTGKPALFMHLGAVADDTKVLSWDLNTRRLAIGTKLNGRVKKVGDIAIDMAMAA